MARLCERPGCSERGAVSYGFDADRLLVWLAAFDPTAERTRAGVLCVRHADAMVVPLGWTLDDLRDPRPPLFRTTRAPRRKRQTRRSSTATPTAPVSDVELPLPTEGRTVAELGGTRPSDPDETVALPWMPVFDQRDDLGGLLHADTPLLARAFHGPSRRR